MALLVLRAIFFMVAMGIAVLIFGSEGIRQGPSWVPWAVLLGMAAVPLTVKRGCTVIFTSPGGVLRGIYRVSYVNNPPAVYIYVSRIAEGDVGPNEYGPDPKRR